MEIFFGGYGKYQDLFNALNTFSGNLFNALNKLPPSIKRLLRRMMLNMPLAIRFRFGLSAFFIK